MSRTEIDAVNREFEDAVRKRDTEKLSALYTPDAIVMPPDDDGGMPYTSWPR